VRRSISKPSELAYYLCRSHTPVPLAELVRVAASRWAVEETFQFAKNETGLDHYQIRRYNAWYRHITLSMLAAAFLAITACTEQLRAQKAHHQQRRAPNSLVLQRNPTALGHPDTSRPPAPPHQPLI
jgi:SRSO17 transposase